MQKWEYLRVTLESMTEVSMNGEKKKVEIGKCNDWDILNGLGNQGWELLSIANPYAHRDLVYFLKRPKP